MSNAKVEKKELTLAKFKNEIMFGYSTKSNFTKKL